MNGAVHYLHTDHLGSTSLTTDAAGDVVARRRYHPYGEERYVAGDVQTDFGYTGQRDVVGTGLMYYHARYYHPGLGRFVSADTIVPAPEKPRDLNRYAYAANNPLGFIDPNGHQVRPPGNCGGICYTGTYGPYNVEYAEPQRQPLTVGTRFSAYDYYKTTDEPIWTAYSVSEEAGIILAYSTDFEVTPKIATVYAPTVQGLELQNVVRYKSGQLTHSREDHIAFGADIPGFPVSLGIDHQRGGETNPEVGIGPVVWGGNDLMIEAKALGSGLEVGAEFGAAGDFYIITTGDTFNKFGSDGIREHFIQREATLLYTITASDYLEALRVFGYANLAYQAATGFPYRWKTTE